MASAPGMDSRSESGMRDGEGVTAGEGRVR